MKVEFGRNKRDLPVVESCLLAGQKREVLVLVLDERSSAEEKKTWPKLGNNSLSLSGLWHKAASLRRAAKFY
jgi:hypothetical protein